MTLLKIFVFFLCVVLVVALLGDVILAAILFLIKAIVVIAVGVLLWLFIKLSWRR